MGKIPPSDIEALIEIFDRSDWAELKLATAGLRIHLSKDGKIRATSMDGFSATTAADGPARDVTPVPAITAAPPAARPHLPALQEGLIAIRAPNLGTFYRAPKPGAAPYVEIGQRIGADTEVCLIEVMKLFTPVRGGVTGEIVQVCVGEGEMVEYDQPLFLVRPAG